MKQSDLPKARYLPPPVSSEIGSAASDAARPVVVLLWCAGATAVAVFLLQQPHYWLPGLVAVVLGAWMAYLELQQVVGVCLEWRHQGWCILHGTSAIETEELSCAPRVVLDLQRRLLLRVRDGRGRIHWVWLVRRDKAQWHRMRCALFAVRQP